MQGRTDGGREKERSGERIGGERLGEGQKEEGRRKEVKRTWWNERKVLVT